MWTVITSKPVKRKLDSIPNPDNERIKAMPTKSDMSN